MNSKYVAALLVTGALLATACSSSTEDPVANDTSSTSATTAIAVTTSTEPPADEDAQLDEFASAVAAALPPGSPGAIVRVDVGGEMVAEAAVGEVAFDSGRPLSPSHPFRIASTTKPITAATVLRLQEEGQLSIDDPISDYLPSDLVDQLHVVDGENRGGEITIRHLLGHTSGLADRIVDAPFVEDVLADPSRVWQPRELVEYMTAHAEAKFAPGEGFSYSDDGYVLLGMIIESVTSRPLHEAYRRLVLDPLGMDDTYLEGHEAPRGLELSHPYIGDFDAAEVHPSVDWGGGGLVSTAADLTRFGASIADGTLFEEAATLEEMTHDPGTGYGLGLAFDDVDGLRVLTHSGFWGSSLIVVPALNVVLAGTVNQVEVDDTESFFIGLGQLAVTGPGVTLGHRPDEVTTVEVDGRTSAYFSDGTGDPTVVFEAGKGNGMEAFLPIAEAVAEDSTVFAYDRAGYGGSDFAEGARDGSKIVQELRAVLAASGHAPPYVLVGHSLGAMYVRLFARTHPEEVAGVVLVDGTPAEVFDCPISQPCGPGEDDLEGEAEPGRSEELAIATTAEQVLAAAPLTDIPAVVIAAGDEEQDKGWLEMQRLQAAALQTELVMAEGSGHFIQFDRPDLVLDAIRAVVDDVQREP